MNVTRKTLFQICAVAVLIGGQLLPVAFQSQAFAQEENTVVLATDPWPPYYGPDLNDGGYFTDIVTEAFKRVGYTCEVKFVPWKRALERAQRGSYDGILGAFYAESRTRDFAYSEPISESHLAFFSKKGRGIRYQTLQDLSQYSIGVIRGYSYSEEFEAATELRTEEVNRVEQNIEKVLANRIDLFIDSQEVVSYLLNTTLSDQKDQLEMLTPPYKTNTLYVLISKKNPQHQRIVNDLNRGLQMLKEDGTYDAILKEHGF